MTGFDLLILAVYFICVAIVFSEILKSFDNKYKIYEDKKELEQQLESEGLSNTVAIKFGFNKRYKLDELQKLTVIVDNKTQRQTVYLNWDMSSLTDLGKQSRRMIRIPPQLTADVFQSQISSTIAPGRTLRQEVTAEDVLKVKDGSYSIDPSLIAITKLNDKKSSADDKNKYTAFMNKGEKLSFFVRLAFQVTNDRGELSNPAYVTCKILLEKLPWTDAFPWNQK